MAHDALPCAGGVPLDCNKLDKLPRPPFSTVKVVHRPMGPLPHTQAIQAPQSCHAHALYLRHEHVLPAAVLQTFDRLQPGAAWSMVALRQQEDLQLRLVDYSLTNSMLLPQPRSARAQGGGGVFESGAGAP